MHNLSFGKLELLEWCSCSVTCIAKVSWSQCDMTVHFQLLHQKINPCTLIFICIFLMETSLKTIYTLKHWKHFPLQQGPITLIYWWQWLSGTVHRFLRGSKQPCAQSRRVSVFKVVQFCSEDWQFDSQALLSVFWIVLEQDSEPQKALKGIALVCECMPKWLLLLTSLWQFRW